MPKLRVRTSERSTFKRCRFQWDLAYNRGLQPLTSAPALRFGSLVHKALELRYPVGRKRGPHPTGTFLKEYDKEANVARGFGFKDADGTWANARELGAAMLDGYVAQYGTDSEYEVLATEQTFSYPVVHRGKTLFTYVGTFDGIWRHRPSKRILLIDYKTTKDDPTRNAHLALDEQASAYWTFGPQWMLDNGFLLPDQMPSHLLYTFLRKAAPDTRPRNDAGHCLNKDGSVSERQPLPLFHREIVYRDPMDRQRTMERAIHEVREMQMIRKGTLAVYKNPGKFTCGGCAFRDACELEETGADWQSYLRQTTKPWDGYAAHEIYEEGK